jgi:hypothetical protein
VKIIFDRSAFHSQFDVIEGSRLLQLTKERKIRVYFTSMFLEETLKRQGARGRGELKRQWPFLRSICNGGWFKPLLDSGAGLKSVCDDELVGARMDKDWPLFPLRIQLDLEATITDCIDRSAPFPEQENALRVITENERTKRTNGYGLVQRRNSPLTRKDETFAEYY